MDLSRLLSLIEEDPRFREVLEAATARAPAPSVSLSLPRAARPPLLAALARRSSIPILLLTPRSERAMLLRDEIAAWDPRVETLLYSEPTPVFYEQSPWGPRTVRERIAALAGLGAAGAGGRPARPLIVIASGRALITPTLPCDAFRAALRTFRAGNSASPEALSREWIDLGYQPASLTVEPGQFSRRGGIVDIWPPADRRPTRLEFFGDQIETLRLFDPATQRTAGPAESLIVTPARELLASDLSRIGRLPNGGKPGADFPYEFWIPWAYKPAGLLDYLPNRGIVAIEEWNELADVVADLEEHALALRGEAEESGVLSADDPLAHLTWDDIREALEIRIPLHLGLGGDDSMLLPIGESFTPAPRFGGMLKTFVEQTHLLRQKKHRVVVVSRQADRLLEVWEEQRPGANPALVPENTPVAPPAEADLVFVHGSLQEGFTFRDLHLLADGDIFGWIRPEPRRRPAAKALPPESAYADLKSGDFVVHIEFGIGVFSGLVRRMVDGLEREYLQVEFGDGGQVYVPIHQADRLMRYIGPDDRAPTLSRLGSQEWTATRERARRAALDVARDMLALYARRESAQGRAFAPDTPWQRELESSFPYVETDDQLRAIAEVKRDMERARPMDRLICGDVGYGKTEVALRAAFKAVMDGVQVAVLVPTTVLAQQHFQTFSQRLAAFPLRVEMLSRFRTPFEQERILEHLGRGEVDILIGTHRLIQRDVAFSNLGLLVIDEEQRFGVAHKEHLKRLRTEVDVLTLTATPIPRTLYLSLAGVRDISNINTPPEERMPVVTRVGPYSEKQVRQAVLRELERGGQVFYLHNRVETIRSVKEKLAALVPEARIRIGHGQMPEHELEHTMDSFVRRDVDVLLCTSIIESGLDIPNANTLIVDRADTFGLAQLHQLRGRVGRGPVRAYAYFFTDRRHRPSPEAYERLQALAEQNELGGGYAIAMRDLEIRGAGEILGTRQSGHIAAIGFHLYTRLLSQAVRRLRAERDGRVPEMENLPPSVDLPLAAALPEDYVPDRDLRLRLYRRMAEIAAEEELAALRRELVDRFGPLPEAAENLLFQLRVKVLAQQAGVDVVALEGGVLMIGAVLGEDVRPAEIHPRGRYSKGRLYIPVTADPEEWRPELLGVLKMIVEKIRARRSE
ncbi:MAG: transcription-repair coupling factor [Anaerolineales bacterium]|nr:transcription-repair coupling factor [Anaerolineales bacterium]